MNGPNARLPRKGAHDIDVFHWPAGGPVVGVTPVDPAVAAYFADGHKGGLPCS
ncbi:hypothetical protein ACFU8W_50945 [Streptomyces sp. NPDC057565]|uniref:hypothetical protein n=1 Tax=Streptomyces sp. NPDC057565 TaxID=3346169 RepID=UPI0036AD6971